MMMIIIMIMMVRMEMMIVMTVMITTVMIITMLLLMMIMMMMMLIKVTIEFFSLFICLFIHLPIYLINISMFNVFLSIHLQVIFRNTGNAKWTQTSVYLTNDYEPDTIESRIQPMETSIDAQNLAHFLVSIQFKQTELCSDDNNIKTFRWTLKQSLYSVSFGEKSANYIIRCRNRVKVNY